MGDWADELARNLLRGGLDEREVDINLLADEFRRVKRHGIERAAKVAEAWSRITGRHVAKAIRSELLNSGEGRKT